MVNSFARLRSGMTLLEVLVILFVIGLLAAVVIPTGLAVLRNIRLRATLESLDHVSEGLRSFYDDVGTYPLRLSHLGRPVVAGELNACVTAYTLPQRSGWRGPYIERETTGGAPLGVAILADTAYSVGDELFLVLGSTTIEDLQELDERVDGSDGANAGTVRWTLTGGVPSGRWVLPKRSC